MLDVEALIYVGAILLYILLRPVYTGIAKRIVSLTKGDIDDKLYDALERPIWFAILIYLVFLAQEAIFPHTLLSNILLTAVVALIAIALIRTGNILIKDVIGPTRFVLTDPKIKQTILTVIDNVVKAAIIFFALMYTLSIWGVDVTPILASAGIVGIVVGLALKDPLENLISGILMLTDPPFRVGDVVRIGDTMGEVKEIGLRNTKILTFDGDVVTIPNSSIIRMDVENYHMPSEKVRVRERIGVSYDTDPEHAKKVLMDILTSHPKILDDPAPQVLFLEFGDSALIMEIRFWVHMPDKMSTIDEVNTTIWKRFKEEGIEIPFPIRTVYLRDER